MQLLEMHCILVILQCENIVVLLLELRQAFQFLWLYTPGTVAQKNIHETSNQRTQTFLLQPY